MIEKQEKPPITLISFKTPFFNGVFDVQWSRSSWHMTTTISQVDLWFHIGRSQPKERRNCSLYHFIFLNLRITFGFYHG
jgi:hypothetical protein